MNKSRAGGGKTVRKGITVKEMCFDELFARYGQYTDWFRGGCCRGKSCAKWGKCRGNEEFDKLAKTPVTAYSVRIAVGRERALGVFDREENYY